MSDHLPPDIWVRIFHKLPLKPLVKCTFVCKAWKSLILDHTFICDHLTNTTQASNQNSSLFLSFCDGRGEQFYSLCSENEEINPLTLLGFSLPDPYQILSVFATCNGLVCFANYSIVDIDDHIIWNPSLRKYVVLPKPTKTCWIHPRMEGGRQGIMYGFGFDSKNKDFKLVRLAGYKGRDDITITPTVAEVYSLATNSWRSITAKAPQFPFNMLVWELNYDPHMFIEGVIHWVVKCSRKGQICYFILTFDVSTETFGVLKLPKCLRKSPFSVSILAAGESLAVLHKDDHSNSEDKFFSIWVMNNYGDEESWTQVFHSDSTRYGSVSRIWALNSNGEVLATSSTNDIVLLDPLTGLVKNLGLGHIYLDFVGYHFPSLFLLNKEHHVLSYFDIFY